jgi:hypothetical protein
MPPEYHSITLTSFECSCSSRQSPSPPGTQLTWLTAYYPIFDMMSFHPPGIKERLRLLAPLSYSRRSIPLRMHIYPDMPRSNSNLPHVNSKSPAAARGDQATRVFHSSFHNGDPIHKPASPSLTDQGSDQSNVFNSPVQSHTSGMSYTFAYMALR